MTLWPIHATFWVHVIQVFWMTSVNIFEKGHICHFLNSWHLISFILITSSFCIGMSCCSIHSCKLGCVLGVPTHLSYPRPSNLWSPNSSATLLISGNNECKEVNSHQEIVGRCEEGEKTRVSIFLMQWYLLKNSLISSSISIRFLSF